MNKKEFLIPFLTIILASCSTSVSSSTFVSESSLSFSSESVISSSSIDYPADLWDLSQNNLRVGVKTVNFYNINDLHGATEFDNDYSINEPGLFKLTTYLKNEKEKDKAGFFLTSTGDMWQGGAASNITKGKYVLDWMNECGFSAMAIGNHDFDWKVETIIDNQAYAPNIPFLACNIVDEITKEAVPWALPYTTATVRGVHIGVIGAIGEGLTKDIVSSNVKGLSFDNPTQYVIKHAKYLKEHGADLILYLQHNDMNSKGSGAENFDKSLYEYVDLCFAGHSHAKNDVLISYNGKKIPVIQAYSNGKDVGFIRMKYDFTNNKSIYDSKNILDTRANTISKLNDDEATVKIYDKYADIIHSITDKVVGYTDSTLERFGELESLAIKYSYVFYQNECEREEKIALVKYNNSRAAIPKGNITYGQVYKSFPFDNYIVVLKVKGAFLLSNNYFMQYYQEYDYYPNGNNIDKNADYFILTINFISEKYDYMAYETNPSMHYDIVYTNVTEDAYPRNIISKYLYLDYPII